MNTRDQLSGTILANRYKVGELLGAGGFGSTYHATDQARFNARCVVKELLPTRRNDFTARRLFEREARLLSQLSHPQIPTLQAYFEEDGRFYLVQDFVAGQTLKARLQRVTRLSESEVRALIHGMLGVLQYLHEREPPVIHRDIKPANLILGDNGTIYLIDFGAVREVLTDDSHTAIGTAGYTPREQAVGHARPASDIYALGATALEAVSGEHPLEWHDKATGLLDWQGKLNCSPEFEKLLSGLLADVQHRFSSATQVREAMTGTFPAIVQSADSHGTSQNAPVAATTSAPVAVPSSTPVSTSGIASDSGAGSHSNQQHAPVATGVSELVSSTPSSTQSAAPAANRHPQPESKPEIISATGSKAHSDSKANGAIINSSSSSSASASLAAASVVVAAPSSISKELTAALPGASAFEMHTAPGRTLSEETNLLPDAAAPKFGSRVSWPLIGVSVAAGLAIVAVLSLFNDNATSTRKANAETTATSADTSSKDPVSGNVPAAAALPSNGTATGVSVDSSKPAPPTQAATNASSRPSDPAKVPVKKTRTDTSAAPSADECDRLLQRLSIGDLLTPEEQARQRRCK